MPRKATGAKVVTCPVCERKIGLARGMLQGHNPRHAEWRYVTHCGGGGMTVVAAVVKRKMIVKLLREAVVLRQIERGTHLTKPGVPGGMVGSSQETLDKREDRYHCLAAGVDHSVLLMRGLPPADADPDD